MARVFVLDVENGETRIAECEELDDFYKELNAEPFDIVMRDIGGKIFDIFVDDMGLFRDDPIVSAVSKSSFNTELVGNLIFANHDKWGNTTDLSDEDISLIRDNLLWVSDIESGKLYQAVMLE